MAELPKHITIGEKYGPAMEMTDQTNADAYFEKCVRHTMTFGSTREEAERIERSNFGYYAGYYGNETQVRVERLFKCSHPIFGATTPGKSVLPEEAFNAGRKMAAAH